MHLVRHRSIPAYNPSIGTQFTIINNDGVDPVVGTFAGIAQNGFTTIGGNTYQDELHGRHWQ